MATFENVGLALQLVANIHGLVHNMRDNAAGYKRDIAKGDTVEKVSDVMVKDAGQYLLRIKWVTDAVSRNQAGVSNALSALNLALSEANSLKVLLTGVANHTLAATLNNGTRIVNEADYILANVPAYERIF